MSIDMFPQGFIDYVLRTDDALPAEFPRVPFEERVRYLLDDLGLPSGRRLRLDCSPEGRLFVQVQGYVRDTDTGMCSWMGGGKAYLSEHMTDSEIVGQVFQKFLAFEEHEAREHFTYRGKAIYGPHIDINALADVADRLDVREG